MGRPAEYSDEQKASALAIYADSGPAAASRLTNIPSGTIASWAHRTPGVRALRAKKTEYQIAEWTARSALTWAETKAGLIEDMAGAADALVHVIHDKIEQEDIRTAKDAALTLAILIDKTQLLTGGATGRQDANVTVVARQEMIGAGRAKIMELAPPVLDVVEVESGEAASG